MATPLADVFVQARLDTSRFAPDISAGVRSSSVLRSVDDSGKRMGGRFSSAFGSALRNIALPLVTGLGAIKVAEFFKGAISEASDLNETLNLTRITFDQNAKSIVRWAQTADTKLGLSANAALQARGQFANMFQQIGFGEDATTRLSGRVVKLAADLGSFRNLGTEDVLERISAGFRGEYDSLQLLVPTITAATVEQRALSDTGKKAAEDLTAQEKAAATLNIVLDKTKNAQGDFARTADGLANSQKILGAEFDNVQAKVGKALLPVVTKFVHFLSDEGLPILEDVGTWLAEDGARALEDFAGFIGDTYEELQPLIKAALPELRDGVQQAGDILKGTADALGEVGEFVGGLPGPVKTLGVEFGVAAIAMGKMRTMAVGSWLTSFATNLGNTETRMVALKSASRSLAGAGGLVALVHGVQNTHREIGILETTIGGALVGFSVGGPWGAAIGAGTGALLGLTDAFGLSADAAKDAVPDIADYTDSLSELTGAATKATRGIVAETLQKQGLLTLGAQFGIAGTTLIDAVIGTDKQMAQAQTRIDDALSAVTDRLERSQDDVRRWQQAIAAGGVPSLGISRDEAARRLIQAQDTAEAINDERKQLVLLGGTVDANRGKFDQDQAARREWIEAVRGSTVDVKEFRKALEDVPVEARSELRLLGYDSSKRDVIDITERYEDIDKRELQAILEVLGLEESKGKIDDLVNHANEKLPGIQDEKVNIDLTARAAKVAAQLGDINVATGGPITGGIPGKDSVRLLAMPGEHMLTTDEVNKAGGHSAIFGLRKMIRNGKFSTTALSTEGIPRFAGGGPVLEASGSGMQSAVASMSALAEAVANRVSSSLSRIVNKLLTALSVTGSLGGPNGTVSVDGEPLTMISAAQLKLAEKLSGMAMSVMQGSFQQPSSYSGTSHTGGGVMDTGPGTFSAQSWLRKVGFAAWARNIPGAASAGSGAHIHSVSGIDPTSAGNSQLAAFRSGGDGLGGSDYGPNPPPIPGLLAAVAKVRAQMFDGGGTLRPGATLAINGSGKPEQVRTDEQIKEERQAQRQALREQAKEHQQAIRELIRTIEHFTIGSGADPGTIHDDFAELIKQVRVAFGKDSPMVGNLADIGAELVAQARRREELDERIAKAQDDLRNLISARRDFIGSTRDAFTTNAFGQEGARTVQGMIAFTRDAVSRARRYLKAERTLIQRGLDRPLIRQLIGSGPDALQAAEALAAASPRDFRVFEQLSATQRSLSGRIGTRAGNELYNSGISAAEGFVEGLRKKRAAISRELEQALTQAIRDIEHRLDGGKDGDGGRKPLVNIEHMHAHDADEASRKIEQRFKRAEALAG